MSYVYKTARRLKNSVPALRWLYSTLSIDKLAPASTDESAYQEKLAAETRIYKDVVDINVLPDIFHYWSNTYLRPMFEPYGFSNPHQFFAKYLRESAESCGDDAPVFVSIGSGNCDTEVAVARMMRNAGLTRFVIECLDMNPHMLRRGREMAIREGVSEHIGFVEGDFNKWKATKRYTGVMANQSLHH